MARSLNKVVLIGNLTRDPELRYTPQGTAVCTFGLATNRQWTTDTGEKKEDVEFHRIVSWNKLAEICAQLLSKGRKTYVEGRLKTRKWTGQDGKERTTTEIVINDMIVLDSRGARSSNNDNDQDFDIPEDAIEDGQQEEKEKSAKSSSKRPKSDKKKKRGKSNAKKSKGKNASDANGDDEDDIPF